MGAEPWIFWIALACFRVFNSYPGRREPIFLLLTALRKLLIFLLNAYEDRKKLQPPRMKIDLYRKPIARIWEQSLESRQLTDLHRYPYLPFDWWHPKSCFSRQIITQSPEHPLPRRCEVTSSKHITALGGFLCSVQTAFCFSTLFEKQAPENMVRKGLWPVKC